MVERPIVGVGEVHYQAQDVGWCEYRQTPQQSTKTVDTFARVEFLVDDSTAFFYLVKGDRVAV